MFFGTNKMCIGASGCMSLKAMISSSSYTLLDGISPFIILQKYNLPFLSYSFQNFICVIYYYLKM